MKSKSAYGLTIVALSLSPVMAIAGEVSFEAGIASEYNFRGITQSDESPALQGAVDYDFGNGASVGVWASTVDFNDGNEAKVETDLYAGYSYKLTDTAALNTKVIYYYYPSADSDLGYDYLELYAGVSEKFGKVEADLGFSYAPDFSSKDEVFYTEANMTLPVNCECKTVDTSFNINGHIGYSAIDNNSVMGMPDYTDWSLGVSKEFKHAITASLDYVDTDLGKTDLADGAEHRVVFKLSKKF